MAQIPDRLTNKFNEFVRNSAVVVGGLSGLISWGAFHAGNRGSGLLTAFVAVGALYVAAIIKVHYRLKGGIANYE